MSQGEGSKGMSQEDRGKGGDSIGKGIEYRKRTVLPEKPSTSGSAFQQSIITQKNVHSRNLKQPSRSRQTFQMPDPDHPQGHIHLHNYQVIGFQSSVFCNLSSFKFHNLLNWETFCYKLVSTRSFLTLFKFKIR